MRIASFRRVGLRAALAAFDAVQRFNAYRSLPAGGTLSTKGAPMPKSFNAYRLLPAGGTAVTHQDQRMSTVSMRIACCRSGGTTTNMTAPIT